MLIVAKQSHLVQYKERLGLVSRTSKGATAEVQQQHTANRISLAAVDL